MKTFRIVGVKGVTEVVRDVEIQMDRGDLFGKKERRCFPKKERAVLESGDDWYEEWIETIGGENFILRLPG